MRYLVKDSGWDGLRGSVERCDDCERPTVHLAAPQGVPVCGDCGYSPAFESIEDEADSEVISFTSYSSQAGYRR
jgi:ribosomal protein L37AE/L43A